MLLRHGLGQAAAADAVDRAVRVVLESGLRTADLAAPGAPVATTREAGDRLVDIVLQAVPVS
jgi:3-isopropylmalate dehydrogenase